MANNNVGRILMTIATCIYGFIPPFVDFGSTHATNPLWTGHARFHVVWQVLTMVCIALISLYLLWLEPKNRQFATKMAGLLGLSVLGVFEINVLVRSLYNGTLADPNGVPPIMGIIDANLFVFTIALVVLIVGWFIESANLKKAIKQDHQVLAGI